MLSPRRTSLVWILAAAAAIGAQPPSKPSPLATTGPKPKPVEAVAPERIDRAVEAGVNFLVARQNPNGSWGSAQNTKGLNIYAPVPGAHHAFRAAVTSLCIATLIESDDQSPEVTAALDRAEKWMFEHLPKLRRATPDALYNNWGHAYGLHGLVRMLRRKTDDEAYQRKVRELIEQQIGMLDRYECVDGGWCYYDFQFQTKKTGGSSISFVTAAVLVAMADARAAGIEIPQRLVDRATASIRRQRMPDFAYAYGEYLKMNPMHGVNRPGGSLGRSQACNLATRLWGDPLVTDDVINTWLDRLFARNGWLDIGRKRPIPHESWFAVAGYFFYFGHYYAGRCIELLPKEDRASHQDQLAHVILDLQENDGSWWDYPFYDYHQQYGTALAVMSLLRCRKAEAGS